LNQSIGIPSSVSSNWFNAKISDNEILEDLFTRFGVAIKDGNSSFEGIKNFNSQTKSTNPVGEKIAMFDQIYLFTLKLVILFLIIIFVIAIVSVSMVSGIFIEKFYNTIILYKVMGYRNFEIHKMILGIFLPVNVLFTIIGSFIPTIVVYAAIKLLASSGGMVIPSIFMWYIPIGVDAVITLLYISIYWYNYNSFNKKHIQEKLQF
jgi:predicted lysophospholipase L1 biosynthesis ABC-type transport system permease subunit